MINMSEYTKLLCLHEAWYITRSIMEEEHSYLAQLHYHDHRQMSLQLPCNTLPRDGTAVHSNQPVVEREEEH